MSACVCLGKEAVQTTSFHGRTSLHQYGMRGFHKGARTAILPFRPQPRPLRRPISLYLQRRSMAPSQRGLTPTDAKRPISGGGGGQSPAVKRSPLASINGTRTPSADGEGSPTEAGSAHVRVPCGGKLNLVQALNCVSLFYDHLSPPILGAPHYQHIEEAVSRAHPRL
jgi:hypothetical protein